MLLDEIATRLVSQSVGGLPGTSESTATGWTIYARELNDAPDQSIALIPSGGFTVGNVDRQYRMPTFQVLVRGSQTASSALETKVAGIQTALDRFDGTISGVNYVDVQQQGEPAFLGRDEKERPLYSLNFVALRSV